MSLHQQHTRADTWKKMLKAMSRIRESAHMLQAEHRGFPDRFNAFDECEVASMQRWADEASLCMQHALGEQQPVAAKVCTVPAHDIA